jgi:hypothetical protein
MSVRIQARRGTEAEWVAADPVLASGELAYSTDTEQLKIGDGVSNWSDLTYIGDLPQQSGFAGLFMTTDGTNLSFADPLPDQSEQNGKFLTTDGASASWGEVDLTPYATSACPIFTGLAIFDGSASFNNSVDFDGDVTTNASLILNNVIDFTSASVIGLDSLPSQEGENGKYLTTDGSVASWGTVDLSAYAPLNVSFSQQNASYTLVLSDAAKQVEIASGSATTLTVPTNDNVPFPIGTAIVVVQAGAGQVTVAGASGVTVNATPGLKLRAQWSVATLVKRATNTWLLTGDVAA